MTSHCKRSYVSDVYQGSGYTPAPSRVCVLLCKTGFLSPTLQILKTGSVDSWLPYLAHLKHIQLGSCVLSNAQGSHVQVRSKCPVHYSWQANGGLGLASLISCYSLLHNWTALHKDGEVAISWPKSRPCICLQRDRGQKEK